MDITRATIPIGVILSVNKLSSRMHFLLIRHLYSSPIYSGVAYWMFLYFKKFIAVYVQFLFLYSFLVQYRENLLLIV